MLYRIPHALAFALIVVAASGVRADVFVYDNDAGEEVRVEATEVGKGQGVLALELPDGRTVLVPAGRINERIAKPAPEPLDDKAVEANLRKVFVDNRLLTTKKKDYVVGLITARPTTDRRLAARKRKSLEKLARLFTSLETKFVTFMRRTNVPVKPQDFPLVILVFESDTNFEQYARMVTGDAGLLAENIAGFYDLRSNHLVLRVSELDDYRTLIHEGIHQLAYNRRIVRRFAAVPVWFNEGFATGFEGDGEDIRNDPKVPSERYAKRAIDARAVNWKEIVQHDRTFQSNRFAGEAYGQAWALHWLLVTKYRTQYKKYVQLLSEKPALAVDDAETRLREFEKTIGVKVEELQKRFPDAIRVAMRRTSDARSFDRTPGAPSSEPGFDARSVFDPRRLASIQSTLSIHAGSDREEPAGTFVARREGVDQ